MKKLRPINMYTREEIKKMEQVLKLSGSDKYAEALKILNSLPEDIIATQETINIMILFNMHQKQYQEVKRLANIYKDYHGEDYDYFKFISSYYKITQQHFLAYQSLVNAQKYDIEDEINQQDINWELARFSFAPEFNNFYDNCKNYISRILKDHKNMFEHQHYNFDINSKYLWNNHFILKMTKNFKNSWDFIVTFDFNIYDMLLLLHLKMAYDELPDTGSMHLIPNTKKLFGYVNSPRGDEIAKNIRFEIQNINKDDDFNILCYTEGDELSTMYYAEYLEYYFRLLGNFKKYIIINEKNISDESFTPLELASVLEQNFPMYNWNRKYYHPNTLFKQLNISPYKKQFINNELLYWKTYSEYNFLGYLHALGAYFVELEIISNNVEYTLSNSLENLISEEWFSLNLITGYMIEGGLKLLLMNIDSTEYIFKQINKYLISKDQHIKKIIFNPVQNLTSRIFVLYDQDGFHADEFSESFYYLEPETKNNGDGKNIKKESNDESAN